MSQTPPTAPCPAPDDIDGRVALECMRMIYQQMPTSISGHMAGIALLAVVFWPLVDHNLIVTWFFAMTMNQAWRTKLYFTFRITDIDLEQVPDYARRWMIGAVISSACWSVASIFFFIPESPLHQAILITSVLAILAVAVPLIASHPPSFRIFVIPVLVSMILRSGWEGDIEHFMLACVVTAMMLSVLAVGGRYHAFLYESLRRRFENEALAERLSIQNAELDRARVVAEQTSRAKTRFFAAASHDLRQPVHAIGLFVGLLTTRIHDPGTRRLVDNIETSVRALESLFDALMDVSKIDTGAIQPKLVNFDILDLIERLRGDFEAEAGAKGLRLHLHPHRCTGICVVHSDPLLVERILRNLIANAIHYTERGGVLVAVRRSGDRLNLEVWDTGIGIAADQQTAIFEEFFQLGNPERNHGKGLGLGLSIVRRLTELLDLPISLRSQPGRGTRFRVGLPIGAPQNPSPAAKPVELLEDCSSQLILLIDDDPSVLDGMTALLSGWGARVLTGATLDEAMAAANKTGRPDMIVCDYRLADGTLGASIVAALRGRFGRQIPAVVLAGAIDPERLAEAHARDYHLLLKPVHPSKLRALINAILADDNDRDGNES